MLIQIPALQRLLRGLRADRMLSLTLLRSKSVERQISMSHSRLTRERPLALSAWLPELAFESQALGREWKSWTSIRAWIEIRSNYPGDLVAPTVRPHHLHADDVH